MEELSETLNEYNHDATSVAFLGVNCRRNGREQNYKIVELDTREQASPLRRLTCLLDNRRSAFPVHLPRHYRLATPLVDSIYLLQCVDGPVVHCIIHLWLATGNLTLVF
jgi:hypothetical protein